MRNTKVTLLGGGGAIGSSAAKALVTSRVFDEVLLADVEIEKIRKLAKVLGENTSAAKVDIHRPETIKDVTKNSDVVLNCTGPFYECGPKVLEAVIEAGKNYVDVCDDYDATVKMLGYDKKAKDAEISALIGMGSSPGASNLFAKFCTSYLQVESVDIYHAHGGEPYEGPGVIKHRLHGMQMDIPVFDEELKTVQFFGEDGKALIQEIEFSGLGKYPVYPYPHPETITLPKYLKGVKWVMNRGVVLPVEYMELIMDMVRLGIVSEEPLDVGSKKIIPLDFAVAYIIKKREELNKKTGFTKPMGGVKVVVKGKEKGKNVQYVVNAASTGGMMEGTGTPAAIGAILMSSIKGKTPKIKMKGVFPPEAAVDPVDAFEWAGKFKEKGGGIGIKVERIDEEGKVKPVALPI
ncbi:MAG: saccharopine dehydrogenase NADP-binding domain-containing protein [Candidatus Atabeyarchaeum deiterrae]